MARVILHGRRVPATAPGAGALSVLLLLVAAAAAADPVADTDAGRRDVSLRYQAYVAGAPVGEAVVNVTVADGRYQVDGNARSNGLLKGFTRWSNTFSARGSLQGTSRQPAEFSYTESDRDKRRHLVVRDGTLQVTKNGKQRPKRPSPAGPDVVSALFVRPHCQADQVIHTGRHVYRLSRIEQDSSTCRYTVVDDDDDTFEIELELGRRGELVVPKKITFHAWLTGWIELTETDPR